MNVKLLVIIVTLSTILNAGVNVVCKAGIMDNNNAKKYINKVLKKEPKNIECILKLANIHLKSGNLLKGYKLIARAYKINKEAVKKSDVVSIVDFALKMADLAKKAKQNNDTSLWNKIGDNFFDMGAYLEAIKVYSKSLEINDMQADTGLKLALCFDKSNQTDEAINELFILIGNDEKDFYAHYYLAKILRYSINDKDSAMRFFGDAKSILLFTKDDFTDLEYTTFINDINRELGK